MKQCLYEGGIFSNFLHQRKLPDWCSYRSMGSSVLAISAPSHPNVKIRGLNVCVVYAICPDKTSLGFQLPSAHLLKVSNETNDLQWTYCPVAIGHTKENEDRLWLSHWRFGNDELEGGEEVCVSVNKHSSLLIKEFGVQFVYEQDTKVNGVQSNWEETPPCVPWSESKYFKGKYFLSNYRYQDHQDLFRWRQDFSYDPEEDDYRFFFKHEDGHVKRILD